jgi:hypothetical protein
MVTVGWRSGPVFIYKVSPTGVEVKESAIVSHVATEADFMYIVAVSSADGSAYRTHGFGLAESLAEFERLIAALKVRVASPDQAESLAHFYRKANPENHEGLTPILGLMELKQAAEQQCQGGAKSFDAGEKAFTAWWSHGSRSMRRFRSNRKLSPTGAVIWLSGWCCRRLQVKTVAALRCEQRLRSAQMVTLAR